ncbi:MAG: FkbM family methyltransferase [Planctomycetota bacterium]|jgi:FkbM family methyltransferase
MKLCEDKLILSPEGPSSSAEESREVCTIDLGRIDRDQEIAARNRLAAVPDDLYAHDVIAKVRYNRYKRIHSQLDQMARTDPSLLEVLDFDGFRMFLEPEDRGSLYTLASYAAGSLEPFELSVFCEMVRKNPGNIFVDVGANYGLYTLHACDLARDNLIPKVVAVEPDKRVFEKLSESVRYNGFENEAILLNKAISDRDDQQVTVFVNKGGSPDNRTFVDGGIDSSSRYPVKTICVDTILSEICRGLEHNGAIIKMDIQGNEPRAFKGMKNTLTRYSSLAVLLEFDPVFMEQQGFDAFEFAHEVFGAAFSDIIHVDETAQLLQPLASVDELISGIRHYCSPQRPKGAKKYLNLLCYRNMRGPSSANRKKTPTKVQSPVSRVADRVPSPDRDLALPVSKGPDIPNLSVTTAVEPMIDVKLRVSQVSREEAVRQAQELCDYARLLSERKDHVAALAFLDQIAIEYSAVLGNIPDLQLSRAVCLKALKRYDEAEAAVTAEIALGGQPSVCNELLNNIRRPRQDKGLVGEKPVSPTPQKASKSCKSCGEESVYFERTFDKDWYACRNCSLLCYDVDEGRAKMLDNGSPEGSKFPTYSNVHRREEFFCRLFLEQLQLTDILLYGIGWSPVYKNLRDSGYNVVGCDLWKPLIRQRNEEFGPGAFYHRDQLPDIGFDVISAFEVFEHFVRPAEDVGLLVDHLKDDGIIVGCTDFWHGGSLKLHPNPDQSYWAHKSHATVWTWKSMNTLAQRFGLKTYYCKTDTRNAAAKVFFVIYRGQAFDGYLRNLPKVLHNVW